MTRTENTRETKAGYIVAIGLPRIIEYLYVSDGGPSDGGRGSDSCPHCGADGRYIHHFRCDDGTTRGAMAGCVKLFPISPIAKTHQTLIKRENDLIKRFGKDARLNSWDTKSLEAINEFYAGTITEADALATIARQDTAKKYYRANKRRG